MTYEIGLPPDRHCLMVIIDMELVCTLLTLISAERKHIVELISKLSKPKYACNQISVFKNELCFNFIFYMKNIIN